MSIKYGVDERYRSAPRRSPCTPPSSWTWTPSSDIVGSRIWSRWTWSPEIASRPADSTLGPYGLKLLGVEGLVVGLLKLLKQRNAGRLKARPLLCELHALRHSLKLAELTPETAPAAWRLIKDVDRGPKDLVPAADSLSRRPAFGRWPDRAPSPCWRPWRGLPAGRPTQGRPAGAIADELALGQRDASCAPVLLAQTPRGASDPADGRVDLSLSTTARAAAGACVRAGSRFPGPRMPGFDDRKIPRQRPCATSATDSFFATRRSWMPAAAAGRASAWRDRFCRDDRGAARRRSHTSSGAGARAASSDSFTSSRNRQQRSGITVSICLRAARGPFAAAHA